MLLKKYPNATERLDWDLDVRVSLDLLGILNSTIIIDLKPNQNQTNLSLYEIESIIGQSLNGWSIIMFNLKGLFVDSPEVNKRNNFVRDTKEIDSPIFSFSYINGSVRDGRLTGKWITPGPSSTNSALFWPESITYFFDHAKRIINEQRNCC
jgi:hypothetical protein